MSSVTHFILFAGTIKLLEAYTQQKVFYDYYFGEKEWRLKEELSHLNVQIPSGSLERIC